MVDPWEPGPGVPFWRTEYWLGDTGLPYQFTSHSETMADHLEKWNQNKPEGAIYRTTGMVFDRAGRLVWTADR